ncbi:hypothetical protein JOM56_009301 [Amanita muscaria]
MYLKTLTYNMAPICINAVPRSRSGKMTISVVSGLSSTAYTVFVHGACIMSLFPLTTQLSNLSHSPTLPYSADQSQTADVVDLSGQIVCSEFIAAGGSGHIYKGRWTAGLTTFGLPTIAVKVISLPPLRDETKKRKRYKRIKRELELWSKVNHQNALPLLGIACINDDTNIPAFICPWMENGTQCEGVLFTQPVLSTFSHIIRYHQRTAILTYF